MLVSLTVQCLKVQQLIITVLFFLYIFCHHKFCFPHFLFLLLVTVCIRTVAKTWVQVLRSFPGFGALLALAMTKDKHSISEGFMLLSTVFCLLVVELEVFLQLASRRMSSEIGVGKRGSKDVSKQVPFLFTLKYQKWKRNLNFRYFLSWWK